MTEDELQELLDSISEDKRKTEGFIEQFRSECAKYASESIEKACDDAISRLDDPHDLVFGASSQQKKNYLERTLYESYLELPAIDRLMIDYSCYSVADEHMVSKEEIIQRLSQRLSAKLSR